MAMSSNGSEIHPALFSPEFQRNPYPTYGRCLAGPCLQPLEGRPGSWLLFGYEVCATIIRDGRLSSMRPATSLVTAPEEGLGEFDDLVRHMQRWLLLRDSPSHAELRKRMNRGFAPAVIEKLRHKVDAIIDDLLGNMCHESADLIKDFAYPLPVRVICELLGLPEELHDRCVVLSNDIAVWFGDIRRPADSARVAQRAVRELEGYFAAAIRERRGSRKDDLLDLLIDATQGESVGGLNENDLHAQCVMLLFAGHETTRNLIGNGIYTLLKNPDALGELYEDQGLWTAATEELLRYESPVQAFSRGVTSDLAIEGTHLPAGSALIFMIGASHRDPRQFPEPNRLDLRRPHNRHLAFGGDAHVCLGSTLARLEGRLSMRAVTRRYPHLSLIDDTPDWGANFALRGLNTLRVQLGPSA
jgi:cytochrome P450